VIYSADLAYVHEAGFGDYARQAAPEIARLLRRRLSGPRAAPHPPPLVVEFGCGGGTLAAYLSTHAGFRVLGIDQSPEMIRMARANAPAAAFKVGAVGSAAIPRCCGVVAIGEVVSYMAQPNIARHEAQLRGFFTRAARALHPRGLLLFDFMESADGRTYRAKSRAGDDWAIVMRAETDGSILTRHITTFRKVDDEYRRSREIHRVRLYSRRRIGEALARAGFSVTMRRSIGKVRLIRGNVVAIAQLQ
jgi:SAM-dependent methyltransferase